MENKEDRSFGCSACWPESPNDAKAAHLYNSIVRPYRKIIDESHFRVTLGQCPTCQQLFVSVFTETIDWDEGNDLSMRQIMPVSRAESELLSQYTSSDMGNPDIYEALKTLAPERRGLQSFSERVEAQWRHGIRLAPHD